VIDDKVQLPGTRRSRGELPGARLKHFLDTKFAALKPGVKIHSVSQTVDQHKSDRYGIDTTYLRTVYAGEVDESFIDQKLPKIEMPREFQEKFGCSVPHVYVMGDQRQEASEYGENAPLVSCVGAWLTRDNFVRIHMQHSGIGAWLRTVMDHPAIGAAINNGAAMRKVSI